MNAPRKRRTELLAAARQIAAVLVQSCKLAQPEREGIFRVLLESSQGRLRGRRDFPRELRAEAVGEEIAFRLPSLRARLREAIGEMAYCGFLIATRQHAKSKLPEGPLARRHLIATSGKSLLCFALPSTKDAAPVGGATAVLNRIKPVRVPCRNRPV